MPFCDRDSWGRTCVRPEIQGGYMRVTHVPSCEYMRGVWQGVCVQMCVCDCKCQLLGSEHGRCVCRCTCVIMNVGCWGVSG